MDCNDEIIVAANSRCSSLATLSLSKSAPCLGIAKVAKSRRISSSVFSVIALDNPVIRNISKNTMYTRDIMAAEAEKVESQMEFILPPSCAAQMAKPSELSLLAPLHTVHQSQPKPESGVPTYEFSMGGPDFVAAGKRLKALQGLDAVVTLCVSPTTIALAASSEGGALYVEEYNASTVGVPDRGVWFSPSMAFLCALAALSVAGAAFDVSINLITKTIAAKLGNVVRRGRLMEDVKADWFDCSAAVLKPDSQAGRDISSVLEKASLFAAKRSDHKLDRIVMTATGVSAGTGEGVARLHREAIAGVYCEIGLEQRAFVLKAFASIPDTVRTLLTDKAHILGNEGRMLAWRTPPGQVEAYRHDMTRFRQDLTIVVERDDVARTLSIFKTGIGPRKPRIGLRLDHQDASVALSLVSHHPDNVICEHRHGVTVVADGELPMPPAFYVDHLNLERVLTWQEGEKCQLELMMHNGIVTIVRIAGAQEQYLLAATAVAVTSTPQRRSRTR